VAILDLVLAELEELRSGRGRGAKARQRREQGAAENVT
jgi:hypothetical protein